MCRNLEDECKSREYSKCKGTGERLGTMCLRSRRPEGLLQVEQGEKGNEVRELGAGGWADFVSPCGLGRAWIFKVK